MLLRRIKVQNVRSFLDAAELHLDGPISIIIGPNGGGKTNLLDTVVTTLRRYLLNRIYAAHVPVAEHSERFEFRHNDALDRMMLDRHSAGAQLEQLIEIELEVAETDLEAMTAMKADAGMLVEKLASRYVNVVSTLSNVATWDLSAVSAGQRLVYRVLNGNLSNDGSPAANIYQDFLRG